MIVLMCLWWVKSAEASGLQVVEGLVHDFGLQESTGARQVLEHEFSLSNSSPRAVKIVSARRSCACSSYVLGKEELQPGEKTSLRMTLDITGYLGPRGAQLAMLARSKDQSEETITLSLRAFPRKSAVLLPARLSLQAHPGETVTGVVQVVVTMAGEVPFETAGIRSSHEWVEGWEANSQMMDPEWKVVAMGQSPMDTEMRQVRRQDVQYMIKVKMPDEWGHHSASIEVTPSTNLYGTITIPIHVISRQAIEAVPPCLYLGNVQSDSPIERSLILKSTETNQTFRVKKLRCRGASNMSQKSRSASDQKLVIAFHPAELGLGVIKESLAIETTLDDGTHQTVEVPVYGFRRK